MPDRPEAGAPRTPGPVRAFLRRPVSLRTGLLAVVAVLLAAELSMQAIEDHLPRNFAGDTVEIELKYEQLQELARAREAGEPDSDVDVLFLGNSTMDAALDPAVFAEASARFDAPYNAALLGQPLPSVERWADELVLPLVDPEAVVVGVTPLDLPDTDLFGVTKTAVEAAFDNSFDELDPTPLRRLDSRLSRYSAVVRNRSAFRSPVELWRAVDDTIDGEQKQFSGIAPTTLEDGTAALRTPEVWRERLLRPRGGNANYWGHTYDGSVFAQMTPEEQRVFRTSTVDLAQIRELVAVIREAGVEEVVLVMTPHNLEGLERTGGSVGSFRRSARAIGRLGDDIGTPVVDFTEADWPLEEYFDLAHLSKRGSTRFSTELAEILDDL